MQKSITFPGGCLFDIYITKTLFLSILFQVEKSNDTSDNISCQCQEARTISTNDINAFSSQDDENDHLMDIPNKPSKSHKKHKRKNLDRMQNKVDKWLSSQPLVCENELETDEFKLHLDQLESDWA